RGREGLLCSVRGAPPGGGGPRPGAERPPCRAHARQGGGRRRARRSVVGRGGLRAALLDSVSELGGGASPGAGRTHRRRLAWRGERVVRRALPRLRRVVRPARS